MKNNVIPRKATKIEVTFNRDVGNHKAGDTTVIEKNEFGQWSDGKYAYFVSMLRTPEICTLKVLEKEPERNGPEKLSSHLNVDVIAFLEDQMKRNTQHYQSDFEIDKAIINRAMESEHREDKTLIWMSRSHGTHCYTEYEAFIQDSAAYSTLRFYAEQTSEPIIAFAVELTGRENGVIRGNVYGMDFQKLVAEISAKAVPCLEVEKTFEDGFVNRAPLDRSSYGYYAGLVDQHGSIVESRSIPSDKDALSLVLFEQKKARDKSVSFEDKLQNACNRAAMGTASQNELNQGAFEHGF